MISLTNSHITYARFTCKTAMLLQSSGMLSSMRATRGPSCCHINRQRQMPPWRIAAAAIAADGGGADGVLPVVLPLPPDLGGCTPQSRWNAVSLAYLGDAVWEAYLRSHFYDASQPRRYGSLVASMANTQAQAGCYRLLTAGGWLTDSEASLMRWAANSSSVAPPAHATRQQYKQATALEVLVAQLYLTDPPRLQQLMAWLLHPSRVHDWRPAPPPPPPARRARPPLPTSAAVQRRQQQQQQQQQPRPQRQQRQQRGQS